MNMPAFTVIHVHHWNRMRFLDRLIVAWCVLLGRPTSVEGTAEFVPMLPPQAAQGVFRGDA